MEEIKMNNNFNVEIDTKTITPIIRELIKEQMRQKDNEEKQRIKQEQLLTKDTKEKPLTDSEIRELRSMIRKFKFEQMEKSQPNIKFRWY